MPRSIHSKSLSFW